MRSWYVFMLCSFFPLLSLATRLEDVSILSAKAGPENLRLKLQAKDSTQGAYFYLDVVKNDPESFEKIILIFEKLIQKEKFRLDLEIPSFSPSPNGSYYRSEGITFISPTEREPNSIKKSKSK